MDPVAAFSLLAALHHFLAFPVPIAAGPLLGLPAGWLGRLVARFGQRAVISGHGRWLWRRGAGQGRGQCGGMHI